MITMNDITLLSDALGTGLLLIAVVGIYNALKTPKSGRTHGASIDTDYPNYGR
jgi:hypothetical protein